MRIELGLQSNFTRPLAFGQSELTKKPKRTRVSTIREPFTGHLPLVSMVIGEPAARSAERDVRGDG